jgi:hypothetical protein
MKKSFLLLALTTAICLIITAAANAQGNSRVYIMKKDGKITEVMDGKHEAVTRDITLPNKATVHPDGSIDDKDGYKKQLNEGEYISFVDGRIRKLSTATTTAATANKSTAATATTAHSSTKPAKRAASPAKKP